MRWLIWLLASLGILAAFEPWGPIVALMYTDKVEVGMVGHDGSIGQMTIGPKTPIPDWAPIPTGVTIGQASFQTAISGSPPAGTVDFNLRQDQKTTAREIRARLEAAGFTVTEPVPGPADAMLDVSGHLWGEHPGDARRVVVTFRESLFSDYAQMVFVIPEPGTKLPPMKY